MFVHTQHPEPSKYQYEETKLYNDVQSVEQFSKILTKVENCQTVGSFVLLGPRVGKHTSSEQVSLRREFNIYIYIYIPCKISRARRLEIIGFETAGKSDVRYTAFPPQER